MVQKECQIRAQNLAERLRQKYKARVRDRVVGVVEARQRPAILRSGMSPMACQEGRSGRRHEKREADGRLIDTAKYGEGIDKYSAKIRTCVTSTTAGVHHMKENARMGSRQPKYGGYAVGGAGCKM